MKNQTMNYLLLLLALYLPTQLFALDYTLEQMNIERYCACQTVPEVIGSKISLTDPEGKLEACKSKLEKEILPQSEVADIYDMIKDAQNKKILCDKKQSKDWFKKYRDLSNSQIDKMEKEIYEKICGVEPDKRPNRLQKDCLESLANLVLDVEKDQYYMTCGSETGATVDLRMSRQKKLENKCIKNKTYSKILYTADTHYFKSVCKNGDILVEGCIEKIIENAKSSNGKSFVKCKNTTKFTTPRSQKVCEEYILSKIVGDSTTLEEETALLQCLKTDKIENCLSNFSIDEKQIANQLKDMYCKAPEYSSDAEKNECFNKLLASLEVPDGFDPEVCKNISDSTLKKACLRKEYISSLINEESNKHLIVTDCWNKDKFPVTVEDEKPNWDEDPVVASSKQCDTDSKAVFADLEKCENITPATITEQDATTQQPVTKINPKKTECISKIEPKYLVNNYLEKLATANGFEPSSCAKDTDKTKCLVENSYDLGPDANLGVGDGDKVVNGGVIPGKDKKTKDLNTPEVTDKDDIPGAGTDNKGSNTNAGITTLFVGAVGVTGANTILGSKGKSTLRSNGKNEKPGDSVGGSLGEDINQANSGSNWFSFFRDVKMMKRYKKATDKDCREIYHAAKSKVIGTVVSTAMVIGGGIAATAMITKEKKKPENKRDHKVYLKAAVLVTATAGGALLVNMAAVKSARTKLEKASIALSKKAQQGKLDCGIQSTSAFIDFNIKTITKAEQKSAIASIYTARSPLEAYLNYSEWNAYFNNEENPLDSIDELAEFKFEEVEQLDKVESLSSMKMMFISMLESTSNIIISRAVANDDESAAKTQQMIKTLLPIAMEFMKKETGNEDGTESSQIGNPVVDANAGVNDCEENGKHLDEEHKKGKEQETLLEGMEKEDEEKNS